jgi:hypothetical protein
MHGFVRGVSSPPDALGGRVQVTNFGLLAAVIRRHDQTSLEDQKASRRRIGGVVSLASTELRRPASVEELANLLDRYDIGSPLDEQPTGVDA